jgi:hypothetical protein
MTLDRNRVKIYIRPGHTDLRKAVNGLTALIQERMKQDPFSGSVYLFCNKGKKLLKAVWWDKWELRFLGILAEPEAVGEGEVAVARERRGSGRTECGTAWDAA